MERYRKPVGARINSDSKLLYRLEEQVQSTIVEAAVELQKILGLSDLYKEAVPEELLQVLDGFESGCSEAAAIAYLEKRGFIVRK